MSEGQGTRGMGSPVDLTEEQALAEQQAREQSEIIIERAQWFPMADGSVRLVAKQHLGEVEVTLRLLNVVAKEAVSVLDAIRDQGYLITNADLASEFNMLANEPDLEVSPRQMELVRQFLKQKGVPR